MMKTRQIINWIELVPILIKEYQEDKTSVAELSRKYNLHPGTIKYQFEKQGIKTRNHREAFGKIQAEEIPNVIKLYADGYSTWEIGEKYGTLNVCILKILRQHNIKLRSRSAAARIYTIDEHYLDKMNTPEKAYFLGLFYAEGHNENNKRNSISVLLTVPDQYILEFYKNEFKSNRPLEFRKTHKKNYSDAYNLRLSSLYLSKKLCDLGCPLGKKSHIIYFPTFIDENLYKYFILGFLDGDGCISSPTQGKKLIVSFSGGYGVLIYIRDILENMTGVKAKLGKRKNTLFTLHYHTTNALKICNWLYSQRPAMFMKRKFEVYKNFVDRRPFQKPLRIKGTIQEQIDDLCLKAKQVIKN